MHEPYHYTRTQETELGTFLIVGGEDHKTGSSDNTEAAHEKLEKYARAHFGVDAFTYRWSGQIIEPADGLPFIGRNSGSRHVYVATGFSGTGMSFGTLSGMILADTVLGRPNRWAHLYTATRVKPLAQAARYLTENVDFPTHLASDRLRRGDADRIEAIQPGEGRLVRSGGKMLAVYREQGGKLHCRSAVCTHLGCYVRWNGAEGTWDCPCHGSRFDVDGEVLNGPAISGLEPASPERDAKAPPAQTAPGSNE
jgi:Rieske Fe-S protein